MTDRRPGSDPSSEDSRTFHYPSQPDYQTAPYEPQQFEKVAHEYQGSQWGGTTGPKNAGGSGTGQQPNPAAPSGDAKATEAPKSKGRWSTGSVLALLVGASVLSTTGTYVALEASRPNRPTSSVTSSFDSALSANPSGKESRSTEPIEVGSATDIASRVLPSVVSINVVTARGGAEGSGSIISSDGLIMTNNHVISLAASQRAKISVVLNDGRSLDAKLVATDPQTDIAVIKAEGADDLQPIAFGDSDRLNVGENVLAVGSPLGLSSTVTVGIVSAVNRPVQAGGDRGGEASLIDAIQTDASINPGNSGGALVNSRAELIGIPTVIATLGGRTGASGSIGLGFAIPVNQARRIADDLIKLGKARHPIIGARINTNSAVIGAEVRDVDGNSPAAQAGLEAGDIVKKVNDRRVESGIGLIAAIRSYPVGATITLTVTKGERDPERTLEVTLAAAENTR